MFLFKSAAQKDLEALLQKLKLNMSNNYKDAAQADFKRFREAYEGYLAAGKLKGAQIEEYKSIMAEYEKKLAGFTHKDQKPYWT